MPSSARAEWTTPDGGALIALPATRVVRIEMKGRVDAETGRRVAKELSGYLASEPAKEVFFELFMLESYASEVRTACTEALLTGWNNVASIKVVARSRIVRMGVAVANVALRGRIESFVNQTAFEADFRLACRKT